MSDKRILYLQALSGVIFSIFLAIHLLNTGLAASSPDVYNAFQRALRPIYQYPAVELLLIMVPLGVHIWAGVTRMFRRRGKDQTPGLRMRVHRWAAWFLLLVVAGHIAATRGASLIFGVYPEFEGVGFALWWNPVFFYPYYALLGLFGLYHGANGFLYALGVLRVRVSPRWRVGKRFWIPVGGAAVILLGAVLGFGGWLFETPSVTDHDYARLYEKHLGVGLPTEDGDVPEKTSPASSMAGQR